MSNLLLDLNDLQEDLDRKIRNKVRLYDEILTSCHNKIKKYCKEFKKQECLFTPPQFVLGRPPYDYGELVQYLLESLNTNGLFAEWNQRHNSIYVSWKPDDINPDAYQQRLKSTSYTDNFDTEITVIKPKLKKKNGTTEEKSRPVTTGVATVEYNGIAKDRVPVNIQRIR